MLGLKEATSVKATYETIKSDKVRGRLFLIFKPELTIAKLISKKLYEDLEDFWLQEIEQRDVIDYETDWHYLAFKKIYELNTDDYFSLLEEVVKPIGIFLYGEDFPKKKRSMSTTIGNAIRRNPIFQRRIVNGKTQYKVKTHSGRTYWMNKEDVE